MADDPESTDDAPAKKSKLPLIIGVVLALAGAGAGFYATWSGMILGSGSVETAQVTEDHDAKPTKKISFVEIEPLMISVAGRPEPKILRFRAQLEVDAARKAEVQELMPRVVDVLNTYLRAVELADLEDRAALMRLRSQMLRRVQVVTGDGRVNDFLIMEFVLT
ncbi:flagellar basal body-associated FliL family protein [Sulfitobacter sp. S190]|uniref:flagellar basal body-associated FliL family protein n=1 Tax=Sulfitobacter sp. S190 TaxID=2867022 RepID=UPI0021A45365|nr:flagellar basal body-associated FliL family protein [Sulfitobacter sp. S190]UWR22358.1 flagellar basal body-associated FliL family protein [Sulfitobacter sp. S190]